jgi:hypothetical protein
MRFDRYFKLIFRIDANIGFYKFAFGGTIVTRMAFYFR